LKNEHSKLLKGLENKEKAGILQPAVCIGDPNAMNLELFLAPDYYSATMETYQLAQTFLQNNREYQASIHFTN